MRSWLGRGKSLQVGITVCCLVAFVLYGYDQGVLSGILQNEDFLNQFNHPSDSETGIIVSCYNLGCLVGCISVCLLYRRQTRAPQDDMVSLAFVTIGAVLQASAHSVAHLVVGRLICGFGTGMKTSTVPMYQSELCDGNSRGRLVSAEVLFVAVGVVVAYWFDFGMSYVGGSVAWRLPIAIQIVFCIGVVILVFALPESPRWLFAHGRDEEAIEVLCSVYDLEPTDEYIVMEKAAILEAIAVEADSTNGKSILSVFRNDDVKTGYRVLLAWGIQFMNQAGGINMVVYYIPSVMVQRVGMSAKMAQIMGGCINMMFMFGSIIPSLALDRMGRRKTMMWGCAGLSLCMALVTALQSQPDASNGQTMAKASVAFFFLYMFIFGSSVNCAPWVYVPEILPLEARTKGTAIGVSSNWLWNFVVVMITPVIINRLEWKAYLIFMVTNMLFVPAVYFFYPETSNLRLEDIDQFFTDGRDPVVVAREMARVRRAGLLLDLEAPSVCERDSRANVLEGEAEKSA